MAKFGQQQNKPEAFFVDRWCARRIRKVADCHLCLHFHECRAQDASVAPAAIEHRENQKRAKDRSWLNDVNVIEEEED